jgi:hypothetical protein
MLPPDMGKMAPLVSYNDTSARLRTLPNAVVMRTLVVRMEGALLGEITGVEEEGTTEGDVDTEGIGESAGEGEEVGFT